MDNRCYGIDFGTTNTRIAYFDGANVSVVPVRSKSGLEYQIPSVVGYKDGRAVAFGREALQRDDLVVVDSIKWRLDSDDPIDIEGYLIKPEQVAYDYFKYIVSVVEKSDRPVVALARTAVTVPVNYSYSSRNTLITTMRKAGIGVERVYHEPIAALYCDASYRKMPGISAVFDWGGGTLDVAVVRYGGGWAQVLALEGMKRGGDDFDLLLRDKAVSNFYNSNRNIPVKPEQLIRHPRLGFELRLLAEEAKKDLSRGKDTSLTRINLFKGLSLEYHVKRDDFEKMIEPDVARALSILERTVRSAGFTEAMLTHILMAGGTCNIPFVQSYIKQAFGFDRVLNSLQEEEGTSMGDIANATAIGAVLLYNSNAKPVFARDIGVRLSDGTGDQDRFYPIFRGGEIITINPKKESFFVANTDSGVARLLICDRLRDDQDHQGTLKKILPVPVDRKEKNINVTFTMNRDLSLTVESTGVIAKSKDCRVHITDLAVGFRMS